MMRKRVESSQCHQALAGYACRALMMAAALVPLLKLNRSVGLLAYGTTATLLKRNNLGRLPHFYFFIRQQQSFNDEAIERLNAMCGDYIGQTWSRSVRQ